MKHIHKTLTALSNTDKVTDIVTRVSCNDLVLEVFNYFL